MLKTHLLGAFLPSPHDGGGLALVALTWSGETGDADRGRAVGGRRAGLSKSMPRGRSRCRTSGPSAPSAASRRTRATTSGLFTVARPSSRQAACRRRRSSSSTRQATSSRRGEVRAPATSGRSRCMASPSTRRTASGSAATARGTRTSSCSRATGKFLRQIGRAGHERRQQRHGKPGPRDADARRSSEQ